MAVPPGPIAFVATVMSANYRPRIFLQDLVQAERELVGQGHSFRVELALVQAGADGQTQALAIKTPSSSVDSTAAPSYWEDMRLEVLTLLHPPIAAHRNVVDLLAVGWESGPFGQVCPILVLPYASHGTLDVFALKPTVTMACKQALLFDVARGLEVQRVILPED